MVAIEGVGRLAAPGIARRTALPAGTDFVMPGEAGAAGAPPSAAAVSPASLASMLTLQEFGSESATDREARRHSDEMLRLLGQLQRVLLGGRDDSANLQRLAELAAAVPQATDRRLAALVSAVMLRVKVELARRQS